MTDRHQATQNPTGLGHTNGHLGVSQTASTRHGIQAHRSATSESRRSTDERPVQQASGHIVNGINGNHVGQHHIPDRQASAVSDASENGSTRHVGDQGNDSGSDADTEDTWDPATGNHPPAVNGTNHTGTNHQRDP